MSSGTTYVCSVYSGFVSSSPPGDNHVSSRTLVSFNRSLNKVGPDSDSKLQTASAAYLSTKLDINCLNRVSIRCMVAPSKLIFPLVLMAALQYSTLALVGGPLVKLPALPNRSIRVSARLSAATAVKRPLPPNPRNKSNV